MKQKLTRALIDEIRKEMPVLTEMEMRCCNGGDGGTTSWDCLFNCMHHMDPSRSAQDYANDYKDIYGLDPTAMGGVPNELIGNVLSVMGFGTTVPGSMTSNRDYYQVATMVNPDGTGHTIIVFAVPDENGKISYFDPTLEGEDGKKVRKVDISDISTIYRIKKADIDTTIGAHEESYGYAYGYFGYGNYEDSYGYGNSYYGNYNYENISDYNGTANSDYSYYN